MHDLDPTPHNIPDSTTIESRTAWSRQRLRHLDVTTDLMTAARILTIGRTTAYRMAREGTFPIPIKRVGHNYRVVVAQLAEFLGLDEEPRR